MSSNKRQKVDAGQGSQLLSAAALRRRLLERQASASTPATATHAGQDDDGERKRKHDTESRDIPRTAEQVLLGTVGAATTADDIYGTPDALEEPPKRKVLQLSSFKPTKETIQTRPDGVGVLKFPDDERLVILGSYGIRVRSGEATISGATLHPSEDIHWVYAPHCHALPVLRCSERSVIEIHPHPSFHGMRSLEKLSPIFGNLWHHVTAQGAKKQTWQILFTTADGPKRAFLQELKAPAEWNKKIADLVAPSDNKDSPVLMICGPKSSGKSTFARILTNKLITLRDGAKGRKWHGVAVLDIDPGQPEFSPPGVVSLVVLDRPTLAPPFCHPTLDRDYIRSSHAIASITPATDIEHYKACVLELFKTYNAMCSRHPLIINTPGWIQGSGLTLLTDLISEIKPQQTLYMSEDGPQDTVESLKSAGQCLAFCTLPSQSIEYASRTALHLRHMQTMSYLHVDPRRQLGADEQMKWNPAPLSHARPTMVNYGTAGRGIMAILCYGYQPEPELLAEAIDGTIVAIVALMETSPLAEHAVQRTPEELPYIQDAAALSPESSQCLGLALVRGIQSEHQLIALSTPLRVYELENRRIVLVSGKFDPPTWAYTEGHYNSAFHTKGGEDSAEVDTQREIPWVEKLHGSQKRAVGSRVWRVRRDLGRNNSTSGD